MTNSIIKDHTYWNSLGKTSETDCEATEEDLVLVIYGVAYLIQRHNSYNNIVAQRIEESKESFFSSLKLLRDILLVNDIRYVRVEGTGKRYSFLSRIPVISVMRDPSSDNNLLYIDLDPKSDLKELSPMTDDITYSQFLKLYEQKDIRFTRHLKEPFWCKTIKVGARTFIFYMDELYDFVLVRDETPSGHTQRDITEVYSWGAEIYERFRKDMEGRELC